jgi:hypothetical protein
MAAQPFAASETTEYFIDSAGVHMVVVFLFWTLVFLNSINAQEKVSFNLVENFDFFWNLGSLGGCVDFFAETHDFELSISIFNLFFEHKGTHIGIEYSPVKIINYYLADGGWNGYFYFFNPNLYWNTFGFETIILGPFVSLNYIALNNTSAGIEWGNVLFNSGLRFFWRTGYGKYRYFIQKIGAEMGYRNDAGDHNFYLTINIDLAIGVVGYMALLLTSSGDD